MIEVVVIFCGDPSHAGKPHKVATFDLLTDGWQERSVYSRKPVPGSTSEPGRGVTVKRPAFEPMVGDRPLRDATPEDFGQPERTKYELRCTCGLVVKVRHERLVPVLDQLAAAGVSSLSLEGLAATIA